MAFLTAGPVAQRITRLTTDQKIPGSNPGRIASSRPLFRWLRGRPLGGSPVEDTVREADL